MNSVDFSALFLLRNADNLNFIATRSSTFSLSVLFSSFRLETVFSKQVMRLSWSSTRSSTTSTFSNSSLWELYTTWSVCSNLSNLPFMCPRILSETFSQINGNNSHVAGVMIWLASASTVSISVSRSRGWKRPLKVFWRLTWHFVA